MATSMHGKSARRITAAEAAGLVKSGDWVDYGAALSQPDVFDRALADRKSELRDVKIRACLSLRPRAVLEADPQRSLTPIFARNLERDAREHGLIPKGFM
jgi:acyl-CoA hydrolase